MNDRSEVAGMVSVIMPFFNTRESFLLEAVESVTQQRYENWELILIDDGSDAPISNVVKRQVHENPEKLMYLEHDQHRNLGISASRNLGLSVARGEFIAFLDADDVWSERQLEEQVEILRMQPTAGMVFGNTLYWSSWPGSTQESRHDRQYDLILRTPQLIRPPNMLKFYLQGRAITPCMTSVIVRRSAIQSNEGFEDSFTGHYEDQVFLAKIWAKNAVYVVDHCWGKYRQHSESITADGDDSTVAIHWRFKYLQWMSQYLVENGLKGTPVWQALQLQFRMSQSSLLRRFILAWRETRRIWRKMCQQILTRVNVA